MTVLVATLLFAVICVAIVAVVTAPVAVVVWLVANLLGVGWQFLSVWSIIVALTTLWVIFAGKVSVKVS